MTTITKERLEEIAELARKAAYKPCAMHMTNLLAACDSEVIEGMARQLLASMEQEPVAWKYRLVELATEGAGPWKMCLAPMEPGRGAAYRTEVIPLYAAPQLPQPAVAITQHFDTIALDTAKMVMCDVNRRDEFLGGDIQLLSRIQCRIDEACRAAMLQGKVDDEVGSWNNHMNTPTAQAGNSPVTQDGWIPVSERMPGRSGVYMVWNGKHIGAVSLFFGSFQCIKPEQITHWRHMPAAPQEEKTERKK
ncbi:hypothetical protein HV077_19835 [Citrobacter freundii]|uniref:DUF551 domain-containing protein n=1 Tax=Citrobacter freundii TaxID=546 RepID=A0A7W3D7S2_CITFR|nr:DUF551 domain-containing protein [Citrobacter freundii]MBA8064597.1 hypothetical protein [Citrobacter freundii]